MALTVGKLRISTIWAQTKSVTGSNTSRQSGPYTKDVSPTISGAACNRIYFVQASLAAGASVTIDLRSVTEPFFGEALTPARGYSIHLYITGTTWTYAEGAANPLLWFLNSGGTISGSSGAEFAFGDDTATTIDNTTRNIKITNTNGGSTALTYTLAVLLGV